MASGYHVSGGIGGPGLPGVLGPEELDARSEWIPVPFARDLLDALAPRLGSEVDLRKVVIAVLCPLSPALDGSPLGALLARLPIDLSAEISSGALAPCASARAPAGAGDYLLEVSRHLMQPPWRAASVVRAVFAAARAVLAPEEADAVALRLPPDLAELWRTAR